MRFEWDERKNEANQRKHEGISFELAALVFSDDACLITPDRVDAQGEQRWHAIGVIALGPGIKDYALVVHVYREDEYGEEIVRIISARWASKNDFRRYQEQAVD